MLRLLTLTASIATCAFGASARTSYPHSILAVPAQADAAHPQRGQISRAVLNASERNQDIRVEVALRMRHFDEFLARTQRGEQIPAAEVAAKYFPLGADEARTAAWLTQAGLRVDRTDLNHLAIFAHGSVRTLETAFQTTFARVSSADGREYSSAVSAPSIPGDLAEVVLGIYGLQPHLKHRAIASAGLRPQASGTTTPPYLPAQVAAAYHAGNLGLTGAGQTIAIIAKAYPAPSDLQAFWSKAGVSATLANVVNVDVLSGPAASPGATYLTEASLDVEWAAALAPGASIRVYGSSEDEPAAWDMTLQQIYADTASVAGLHVLSISFAGAEQEFPQDYLAIQAQYFANLANAGVTTFAGSGDHGAMAGDTGTTGSSFAIQVSTPSSDPSVTAVGGTTLTLDSSGNVASETAWSKSGGGMSGYFTRPSWQVGAGISIGTFRLVPDVAAIGDVNTGVVVILGGSEIQLGGTSLSTPVWAAFAALVNQQRARNGQGPLGALNPRLYPLISTSAFRDIVSGSNGLYSAGAGYDEVTGLGAPNVGALLQASLEVNPPLTLVAAFPGTDSVAGQSAAFNVAASGAGPISYQWQRLVAGMSQWVDLTDTGAYSGSAAALLEVTPTNYAMNQDQFRCIVANASGTLTSAPAALLVNSVGLTTLAGWPGSFGFADGKGWNARFDFISALTVDGSGNLYVADGEGNTLRFVTPDGTVTTIAGTPGQAGLVDGTGPAARFNLPAGVAIDAAGNCYVADSLNYAVRKVAPGGIVTTFAGNGHQGVVDGTGGAAEFAEPAAIAIDTSGVLYVAEGKVAVVRKITPDGTVTTLAGIANVAGSADGVGSAARFSNLQGIAVDGSGNVFVADFGNNSIRMITPAGAVSTLALKYASADPALKQPTGLRVDTFGNLYVMDSGNALVRLISPANAITTLTGISQRSECVDGPLGVGEIGSNGSDVALAPGGIIYIADGQLSVLRRLVPGKLVAPLIQTQPANQTAVVSHPVTIAVAPTASTTLPVTYQWQINPPINTGFTNLKDGTGYSGSTTASLVISSAAFAQNGAQFQCVLTNNAGYVTSAIATLTVVGAPVALIAPETIGVKIGGTTTLSADVAGGGLSYQWLFNGLPLAGATGPSYTLAGFVASNAGTYAVTAANSYGSVTTSVATVVASTTRIVNLSSLGLSTPTSQLTAGFILGGGFESKSVLVRAIGPALAAAPFSLPGTLPDPTVTIQIPGTTLVVARDTGWSTSASNIPTLDTAFAQTGAFPLIVGSADSALLASLTVQGDTRYSAVVGSVTGKSGVVLAEIYDADGGSPAAKLLNVSTIAPVTASNALTSGFSIVGSGYDEVLIRAIGPTLAGFNITGTLKTPLLTVVDTHSQTTVAANSGWTNDPAQYAALKSAMSDVGAFGLATGSADAAILINLPPGTYSAQVTGVGGATGTVLLEIYEVSQ